MTNTLTLCWIHFNSQTLPERLTPNRVQAVIKANGGNTKF